MNIASKDANSRVEKNTHRSNGFPRLLSGTTVVRLAIKLVGLTSFVVPVFDRVIRQRNFYAHARECASYAFGNKRLRTNDRREWVEGDVFNEKMTT